MINYTYLLNIEQEFPRKESQAWIEKNWTWSFSVVGLYLTLIVCLQHYMRSRPRLELQRLLLFWNGGLSLFSILGTQRMLPDLLDIYRKHGFHYAFCNSEFLYNTKLCLWIGLFTGSKLVEFGDTFFIIVRKQPLTFLHWYHHATVFLYTTYGTVNHVVSGLWFAAINMLTHSVMYTYFFLKTLHIHVPRQVSMVITILQLSQMVIGIVVNVYTLVCVWIGEPCVNNFKYIMVSLPIYFSYFLLFLYYFHHAYLSNKLFIKPTKKD